LHQHFNVLRSLSLLTVWLFNSLAKDISTKAARKISVKLTTKAQSCNPILPNQFFSSGDNPIKEIKSSKIINWF